MEENDIDMELMEEWVAIIRRLWEAINKPVDEKQLAVYIRELSAIPMDLLDRAISRVIRDNQYPNIPSVGSVWHSLRVELGNPLDVRRAMDEWTARQENGIAQVQAGEWSRVA